MWVDTVSGQQRIYHFNHYSTSPATFDDLEGFGRRSRLDPVKFVCRVAGFAAGVGVLGGEAGVLGELVECGVVCVGGGA